MFQGPCVVFWELFGGCVVEDAVDDFVGEGGELGQFFFEIEGFRGHLEGFGGF